MNFDHFHQLPHPDVPAGYELRRVQTEDDVRAWAQLLHDNGELGQWDMERARRATEEGTVWRESIHFLEKDGVPVATSCVQRHDDRPDRPELGWIAVLPAYRGQGLGRTISIAVMNFMKQQGYERCFLRTDDRRLPAIQLYFRLGFEPDMTGHDSYEKRWEAVRAAMVHR